MPFPHSNTVPNPSLSPSSPRQIAIDPHLPQTRSQSVTSPNALSPSRPIGPGGAHGHRQSGGVGRSYRDDPEGARQRQMQQDIESAMSMCKSRGVDGDVGLREV